jgi:archaellum component FlaC
MTQSNDPNARNLDRQLRSLNRRVDRLEYAQISPQEFSESFDRVYDEIDGLKDLMNAWFDRVNERFDRLESEIRGVNGKFDDLNRKFDIVMQYITGQGAN